MMGDSWDKMLKELGKEPVMAVPPSRVHSFLDVLSGAKILAPDGNEFILGSDNAIELANALASVGDDQFDAMRQLFVEYVSKAQDGFSTGRDELTILRDYERLTGRDFVKDREEHRKALRTQG